jgi:hypothetical protein
MGDEIEKAAGYVRVLGGEIEHVDPESEATFNALVEAIRWELAARMAMGDPQGPDGIRELAELVADTVLDRFVVRERTDETPRYRRSD